MFQEWTLAKAGDLYRIPYWGAGYFGLSEEGKVTVGVAVEADSKLTSFSG